MLKRTVPFVAVAAMALTGCAPTPEPTDAGTTVTDAGVEEDAGMVEVDAGHDAGMVEIDAGPDAGMEIDAGPDAGMDAGMMIPDAGMEMDAGPVMNGHDYANAQPLTVPTDMPVSFDLTNAADLPPGEECYAFTLTDFHLVTIDSNNGAGSCNGDTEARLYTGGEAEKPTRDSAIVRDDDGGDGLCPKIGPLNMGPGDYVVCFNELGDNANAEGNQFTVALEDGIEFPTANQACEAAIDLGELAIGGSAAAAGTTQGASNDYAPSCGTSTEADRTAGDVFYTFTASEEGRASISLTGGFGRALAVTSGTCTTEAVDGGAPTTTFGAQLGCDASSSTSGTRRAIVDVVAGETYTIAVDGYAGGTGSFDLSVQLVPASGFNDTCELADAIVLPAEGGSIELSGSTEGFSDTANSSDFGRNCQGTTGTGAQADAYFQFTAPADGWFNLSGNDPSGGLDFVIYALRGGCPLAGENFACQDSAFQNVKTYVAAGDVVTLVVDSYYKATATNPREGEYAFTAEFQPAPAAGWTCDPADYDSGEDGVTDGECNCGCGIVDPDCADLTAECDESNCVAANEGPVPTNNAECAPPAPDWSCAFGLYDEGDAGATDGQCDCGCGAFDPDCADATQAICDDDHCDADNERAVDGNNEICAAPAPGWVCDASKYDEAEPGQSDGECDCGCGAFDPDCLGDLAMMCDTINCEDDLSVPVDGNNAMCEPRVTGWTCDADLYGEGGSGKCDCGCGVIDSDCYGELGADACDVNRCAEPNEGPSELDNTQCVPPVPGWTCTIESYSDDDCDCGCGAEDPVCAALPGAGLGKCASANCEAPLIPAVDQLGQCVEATAPSNDLCSAPLALGLDQDAMAMGLVPDDGSIVSSTSYIIAASHTVEIGHDGEACQSAQTAQRDAWFTVTAPADGKLLVGASGAGFRAAVGIYDATTDCGALTSAACGRASSASTAASVEFDVVGGTEYLIAVAGFTDADEGVFRVFANFIPPPLDLNGSETCDGAPNLDMYGRSLVINGTLEGFVNDYERESFSVIGDGADSVYAFTLQDGETVRANIVGQDFDDYMFLYEDCGATELDYHDTGAMTYTNDTGAAQSLFLVVDMYYEIGGGFGDAGTPGPYTLEFDITGP